MVGGRSVGATLDRAIEGGAVIRREDGSLSLARVAGAPGEFTIYSGYINKLGAFRRPCDFLNDFLFEQVYAGAAVPFGCRECYKIKVASGSLRQLMAVKDIAETSGHTTKSGAEVDTPTNQQLYGTYLYFIGLDQARQAFKGIRDGIDRHEQLGPAVKMTIKRGCSNYERNCGPSDQYAFDPRLEAVEAYLHQRFASERPPRRMKKKMLDALRLLRMVEIAYRIGDETYKDFTDGKPVYPELVNYAADEPTG